MSEAFPRSVLLGLIGDDIGASKSPMLHECEAARQGLQLVYRLVDFKRAGFAVTDLAATLHAADALGYDGFNVTHPYKTAVIPLLHSLSPETAAIGAANTILIRNGHRSGHNTDWDGFADSIRHGLPGAELRQVAQIGAGGAGAATAYAMLTLGTQRLLIHDLDVARAQALAEKLRPHFSKRTIVAVTDVADALLDSDGVVQATPIGMSIHPGIPFGPGLLTKNMWVADVIYTPLETELLMQARKLGCRTINGSGMLCFQAAKVFQLFTGLKSDGQRMLQYFEQ